MEHHENLIGGVRRPAAAGARFAARPGEEARWPRSTAADVQAALDALAPAAAAWAARAPSERERILGDASRDLVEAPDPTRELAVAVGLDDGENFPEPALCGHPSGADERPARQGGIALVRAQASELLEGPAQAALAELARGRGVLLLSTGTLPEAAERVTRALLAAGLPPTTLALVHDDGESCLGAAVDAGVVASVRVSTERDRVDALRRRISRVPMRNAFGVGVAVEAEFAAPLVAAPRSLAVEVRPDADPDEAALSVARSAFGRLETLGGQRAGRTGMVRVASRLFSAFTEALLAELERRGRRYRVPAWLNPRIPDRLETLRAWGVDEGATLIHEPRGVASRSTSSRDTLLRLVFTNVEPGMRLAQDLDAAPVLLLARADDSTDRAAPPEARPTDSESDLEP